MVKVRKVQPEQPAETEEYIPRSYNDTKVFQVDVRIRDSKGDPICILGPICFSELDGMGWSNNFQSFIGRLVHAAVNQAMAIIMGKRRPIPQGNFEQERRNQLAALLQAGKADPGYTTLLPVDPSDPRKFVMITEIRKTS